MSPQVKATNAASAEADAYPLSKELVESYRRNGFVKIPELLKPDEAARYRERALALNEDFFATANPFRARATPSSTSS